MKALQANRNDSLIILIDCQEKLLPAVENWQQVAAATVKLLEGAKALEVPIMVTTQYAKGLGDTMEPIHSALGEYIPYDKTCFSVMQNHEFADAFRKTGKRQAILCGIEAHVCVMQSAFDLIEQGYDVFVITDCISSRGEYNRRCGIKRMAAAGITCTTWEAMLFELLRGSKEPGFKAISDIVK